MAGLVPAIHVFLWPRASESKTWMPGTRPCMTSVECFTRPNARGKAIVGSRKGSTQLRRFNHAAGSTSLDAMHVGEEQILPRSGHALDAAGLVHELDQRHDVGGRGGVVQRHDADRVHAQ